MITWLSASRSLRNHLQNAWWNNSTWFLPASTLIRRSYLVTYVFISATSMSRSGLGLKTGIYAWKSGIVEGFVSPIEFLITVFNQLSWFFAILSGIARSVSWFRELLGVPYLRCGLVCPPGFPDCYLPRSPLLARICPLCTGLPR